MKSELDTLRDGTRRLDEARIPYMLTGSLAMAFYVEPRFTNDIDLILEIAPADAPRLIAAFRDDYYVPEEIVADEIRKRGLFNFIHIASNIKLDLIPLLDDDLERGKFSRRTRRPLGDFQVTVISREDLILSKLAWARRTGSEMQLRDIARLAEGPLDDLYLQAWIRRLGLDALWTKARA